MKTGYLSLILHAHLPYVHHPEHESFFEENWLFEAMTECYIPLINALDRLQRDNIPYRLTLSLSPPLITMLRDELLQVRYVKHLHKLIELAEKETQRTETETNSPFNPLAHYYLALFQNTLAVYQQYQGDLLQAFIKHHNTGRLELITCAATHGFLPLLNVSKTAVRNQINLGVQTFKTHLGFAPPGIWLPECAYYPGIESHLAEADLKYFFVDSHGIMDATTVPVNGVYAPLNCGNGVMAFGRDTESSKQVWSSHEGYPGDYDYREYYKDIGFDLDLDYIAPYILDNHIRINTGIKYFRVTGNDDPKQLYCPEKALEKAQQHAQDFINKQQQHIEVLNTSMDRTPIIVAPYDAELFGHWWFEGPQWLEQVLRITSTDNNNVKTVTCSDYLAVQKNHQIATPSASTWGDQGYYSYWLNETNAWIYPFLHQAETDMERLALDLHGLMLTALQVRALNQAARSLLLAQASDWPFIMKAGTTTEYAHKRITDHLARFNYLQDALRKNNINERYLTALEMMDNIFPDIDYRDYYPKP